MGFVSWTKADRKRLAASLASGIFFFHLLGLLMGFWITSDPPVEQRAEFLWSLQCVTLVSMSLPLVILGPLALWLADEVRRRNKQRHVAGS